jgi:isoquinoline 1-oxidoreductase alpha subunit
MTRLEINGETFEVDVDEQMPLLWVLRDVLGMRGTKFGCGISQCGACTVHVDGAATRSCQRPIGTLEGRSITTIEGLGGGREHALQSAWKELAVPQCGYCQPGQIMAAAALLAANPTPGDDEIDDAMAGNLCRCGTYKRIRLAIHRAGEDSE